MGTTPKYAIPYIEPADHLNVYPAADQASATQLEAILAGTPWVALTAAYAGTVYYRTIGSLVIIQIDLTGTFSNGVVYNLVNGAPTALRPLRNARGAADWSGYPGSATMSTGGNIQGRHFSGADRAAISATLVYSIG